MTVSKILKYLRTEEKILKRKRKYFPLNDEPVNVNLLAAAIHIQFRRMLSLYKPRSGLSTAFYKGGFTTKDGTAKCIFEFANLVGAFIVYLLIESMRPGEVSQKYKENINLLEHLIQNSIPLDELAKKFRERLEISRIHNRVYSDVKNEDFIRLSQAFMKVYPNIHKNLEEGWESMCQLILTSRNNNKQKDCDHNWCEHYLYKYGKYYKCHKCYSRKTTKNK
jgi:hypothetical protein